MIRTEFSTIFHDSLELRVLLVKIVLIERMKIQREDLYLTLDVMRASCILCMMKDKKRSESKLIHLIHFEATPHDDNSQQIVYMIHCA